MDWIRRLNPFLVVRAPALRRELGRLNVIQLREASSRQVPILELIAGNGLEQPPADNLESLFRCCRPPGRFDTSNHVAQAIQCLAPPDATHLYVVGLGVW